MGYNLKLQSITQVETLLDQLVVATKAIMWKSNQPSKLVFKLRQAMKAVDTHYSKGFPSYTDLNKKWLLSVKEDCVIASPRNPELEFELAIVTLTYGSEISSAMEAIGKIITESADTYEFSGLLLQAERDRLDKWCFNQKYEFSIGYSIDTFNCVVRKK